MPDIPNRDEQESQYARLMARLLRKYGNKLMEKLGNPPSLANIPDEFWKDEAGIMAAGLQPLSERVYLDAAHRLIGETNVGIDWTLVNERAVTWANNYTFDLVTGLQQTDRQTLQREIADFFAEGRTRGELEERLQGQFGPVRASMIAVTEITRASVSGEQAIAAELEAHGIRMRPVWETNQDELVCLACGPKQGKEIADGEFPPAHVNCRCWIVYELPEAPK